MSTLSLNVLQFQLIGNRIGIKTEKDSTSALSHLTLMLRCALFRHRNGTGMGSCCGSSWTGAGLRPMTSVVGMRDLVSQVEPLGLVR